MHGEQVNMTSGLAWRGKLKIPVESYNHRFYQPRFALKTTGDQAMQTLSLSLSLGANPYFAWKIANLSKPV